MSEVHIRWMIKKDLQDILAIEQRCFFEPWAKEDFLNLLKTSSVGSVATLDEEVIGYVVYRTPPRSGCVVIDNFAVSPDHRDVGVGSEMLYRLIGKLNDRRRRIEILIHETNLEAQLFFSRKGFRCVEIVNTDKPRYKFVYQCGTKQSLPKNRISGLFSKGWSI